MRSHTPGWVVSASLLLIAGLGVLVSTAGPRLVSGARAALERAAPALWVLGRTLGAALLIALSLLGILLVATLIRRSWRRAQQVTYQEAWRQASQEATSAVLEQVRVVQHAHLKSAVLEAQALLAATQAAQDSEQRSFRLQELEHSLNRLRRLITELHGQVSRAVDAEAADSALPRDLERTLREVTQNYRTLVPHCTLEVLGTPTQPIPANVRAALVMGLYNALANAHTHGKAQAVRVRLEYRLADVALTVHDNGCGFDVARARAAGRGRGIHDLFALTEQQGGAVTITSALGQGTDVLITLPLTRPALGWAADPSGFAASPPARTNEEVSDARYRIHPTLETRNRSPADSADDSGGGRYGDRARSGLRSPDPPWTQRHRG
jgi:signal transduction histidine kinase